MPEPRSAGLAQDQRQYRSGAGEPEGPPRNGHGPAAVYQVVDEHHALSLQRGEGRLQVRAHHEAVPDAGQAVRAVAAPTARGAAVFELQLAEVRDAADLG